jgi:hypothetical protein
MLLREGNHPFDFEYVGPGMRPTLKDAIKKGYWADSGRFAEFQPLKDVKPFSALPQGIQYLFYQTFELGFADPSKRPSMKEWVSELSSHSSCFRASLSRRVWVEVTQTPRPSRKPCPTLGRAGKRLVLGTSVAAAIGVAAIGSFSHFSKSLPKSDEPNYSQPNVATTDGDRARLIPYTSYSGSITPTGAPSKPALWGLAR